jgi:hypothetical protein
MSTVSPEPLPEPSGRHPDPAIARSLLERANPGASGAASMSSVSCGRINSGGAARARPAAGRAMPGERAGSAYETGACASSR